MERYKYIGGINERRNIMNINDKVIELGMRIALESNKTCLFQLVLEAFQKYEYDDEDCEWLEYKKAPGGGRVKRTPEEKLAVIKRPAIGIMGKNKSLLERAHPEYNFAPIWGKEPGEWGREKLIGFKILERGNHQDDFIVHYYLDKKRQDHIERQQSLIALGDKSFRNGFINEVQLGVLTGTERRNLNKFIFAKARVQRIAVSMEKSNAKRLKSGDAEVELQLEREKAEPAEELTQKIKKARKKVDQEETE